VTTTPLGRHLRELIASQGPLTMARFMAEALGHPEYGYYMTRNPFGAEGDFVTAPEVSQMFGELIGAWCADLWMQMGAPAKVYLVELGPGRGTLMSDALRATKSVPGFHAAIHLHLVETSPRLRDIQATTLGSFAPIWHDSATELPSGPMIVLANELFDALPVHQFQFNDNQWHERLIDFAPSGDDLALVLDPSPALRPSLQRFHQPHDDAIAEICPAGITLTEQLATRFAQAPGAALVIDYGHAASGFGDSVQGVRAHQFQPILVAPGTIDLCAHVDFAALEEAAAGVGAATWGPVPQRDFLKALGIDARAAALSTASPPDAPEIAAAVHRLTHSDEMGTLFKVLAFCSANLHPAGFDLRDSI